MFTKHKKQMSRPVVCPSCGKTLHTLESGRPVCLECNWNGVPAAEKTALEDYFDRTITSPFLRAAMKDSCR